MERKREKKKSTNFQRQDSPRWSHAMLCYGGTVLRSRLRLSCQHGVREETKSPGGHRKQHQTQKKRMNRRLFCVCRLVWRRMTTDINPFPASKTAIFFANSIRVYFLESCFFDLYIFLPVYNSLHFANILIEFFRFLYCATLHWRQFSRKSQTEAKSRILISRADSRTRSDEVGGLSPSHHL